MPAQARTQGAEPIRRASVRQVDVTSVVDQVASELRRSIVSGALTPGQAISLREMADQLGVSFIPLREALRRLEAQGLVVTSPGRSAVVAPMHHEDLRSIYRLRELIEPEIAGRASTLLTKDDLAELEQFIEGLAQPQDDIEDGWELHRLFHVALLRPAATAWDMRTLEMLWDAGERYVRHSFDRLALAPDEPRRRSDAHRVLLSTVASGDSVATSAAMRGHLLRNKEIATRGLEDDRAVETTSRGVESA